jgi:hypothetical protein
MKEEKFDYPIATIRIRQFGIWKKNDNVETKKNVKYLVDIKQGEYGIGFSCRRREVWKRIKEEVSL